MVLYLLLLFNPSLIAKMLLVLVSFMATDLECSSKLAILVPFPYSRGKSTCYYILSPLPDIIRMSTSTISFLVQLDSGIVCLQNVLNGFTSRDNGHLSLITYKLYLIKFLVLFSLQVHALYYLFSMLYVLVLAIHTVFIN